MNTIVRTHIKNNERLATLERLIVSWKEKGLNELGDFYLVDDHSPMNKEVEELAIKHNVIYKVADGYADTKNGLVESLKLSPNEPVLCCVDDMVFGKDIKERLVQFLEKEQSIIDEYGMTGMFACYQEHTRNTFKTTSTDLWHIPNNIIYALVCHVFSPKLSKILIEEWELIKNKLYPDPCCCDDIWVARICTRENFKCYNTMIDYAQHTGMGNRTFEEQQTDGSHYMSPCFIGE